MKHSLPFNTSCSRDELWKCSWQSSCLSYFPGVQERFISCFQPKTRLLGWQFQGAGSALSAQFLLCLWSASAPLVQSETTAASLWRGELESLVKQTCSRLWLLNSPVQMQGSTKLQCPDPTGGLCRASLDVAILPVCLRHSCSHWVVATEL